MLAPAITLDPELPADAAIARILLSYFSVMDRHEAGVLDASDPEHLHDFRVAIRSSRSILNQTRGVFPVRPTLRFRNNLAWLAAATGETRDLDVFVGRLPEYQALLPDSAAAALDPLRRFLEQQRELARSRLAKTLTSKRYHAFKVAYERFLSARAQVNGGPARREGAVVDLVAKSIRRRYRKLRKEGEQAGGAAQAENLHELRKTGKKLRYLIEAFKSLCVEDEARVVVKGLKALQDLLGEVVDLGVQRRLLRQWARAMVRSDAEVSNTLMAMQALDVSLAQAELETRRTFHGHIGTYGNREMRNRMKRLVVQGSG